MATGERRLLGYLIDEKFLNYLQASDSNSDWSKKIRLLTEQIKRIFTVKELKTYICDTVLTQDPNTLGAMGIDVHPYASRRTV